MRISTLVILVLVALFFSAAFLTPQKEEVKIYYVMDPLCGWCYGFSEVSGKLDSALGVQNIHMNSITGGMITGKRIGPIAPMVDFFKKSYPTLEQKTGVKFGKGFINGTLNKPETIYNSIPPSIAIAIVGTEKPIQKLRFIRAIQKAIYFDGIAPTDTVALSRISADFGFDQKEFYTKMKDKRYLEIAQKDFRIAKEMGVKGFPTIVGEKNGEFDLINVGYSNFEKVHQKILNWINQ